MPQLKYKIARRTPVLRFYYKGNHSHPVRRTIIKVEETDTKITGYEIRCGNETVELRSAPIRSYSKDRIANIKELDPRYGLRKKAIKNKKSQSVSTLSRNNLENLIIEGA